MQEQQEEKNERNAERTKKLAVALTVAGTLLVLFFIIILIVQFVQIGVKNARIRELERQEEELKGEIDEGQGKLDWYLKEDGLYWLAIKNNWATGGK